MRTLLKLAGVLTIAGLVIPPVAAALVKRRITTTDDPDAPEVALATIFDGEDLTNRSTAFRGGTTICWYGGQRLDLREATLAAEGATLRARCVFGGLQVLVPETWRVEVRSLPVFGGVDDRSAGADGEGPVLTIDALCVFGGVSIATRDEDAWQMERPAPKAPETADAG